MVGPARKTTIVSRVTLGILGAVFALGIVEVTFAVANIAPVHQLRKRPPWENASHELFGWAYIPGTEFVYRTFWEPFDVRSKINSKGLREREYSYQKDNDVYRILMIGDSFTASLEVPLDQVWHEIVERDMAKDSYARVEIIGAGVQGWATDQQLLYYRQEGYKYDPDAVILQYWFDDLANNDVESLAETRRGNTLRYEKPYFVSVEGRLELKNFPYRGEGYWYDSPSAPGATDGVRTFLRRNSHIYRFVRTLVINRRRILPHPFCSRTRGVPETLLVYSSGGSSKTQAAWELTTRLISQLYTEVVRDGRKFGVVYIPDRRQVLPDAWRQAMECWPETQKLSWDLDKPNRVLGEYLRQHRVPFLDMTRDFRERAGRSGERLFFDEDWHFDITGHRLAAEIFQAWLLRIEFVPQ